MHTTLTRRALLAALTGALATPLLARGDATTTRRLVLVIADGGWDPTFALDPKLGLGTVDGPGVDTDPGNPFDVELVETISGIPLALNPSRRPAVTTLFEKWGHRACVVNGLWVGALNHQQGLRRVLTGTPLDGGPDLTTISGVTLGTSLPVGSVDLSGMGRFGDHAASTVRGGSRGQLRGLLDPSIRFPAPAGTGFERPGFAPTDAQRALTHGWLEQRASADAHRLGEATGATQQFAARAEAVRRAGELRADGSELAQTLGEGQRPTLLDKMSFAVDLLAGGVSHSVMVGSTLQWDTHADHAQQHGSWNALAVGLLHLMAELERTGLLEDTVVAVLSEMGRTPLRNEHDGTDHWPTTSALFMGGGVSGGRVCGATDDLMRPTPLDLNTGAPNPDGQLLRYDHLAAGILDLVGVDPHSWFPGVTPFRGPTAG